MNYPRYVLSEIERERDDDACVMIQWWQSQNMLNIYQANFSLYFENIGRDLEIMFIQSKLTARTLAHFVKKILEASLGKE